MTLIEVIGVLIIIAILMLVVGNSISRNVKRGNRESVVSELELFATSIADAYYDLGSPDYDNTSEEDVKSQFDTFLTVIEKDYLTVQFDHSTLEPTAKGYSVEIASPIDIYEKRYKCWFVTTSDVMKYVMVASGGENGIIEDAGYATGDYKDDIVLIVRPKL